MAALVLTLIGNDRAGLVAAVADVVEAHEGNWENSRLAELAGAFAGIVEVSVPSERVHAFRDALGRIEGLVTVALETAGPRDAVGRRLLEISVLGNDRAGIVREITTALHAHGVSIERMATTTREAAMSGGRLFEATITAAAPGSADLSAVQDELERIAAEIQVDLTLAD
jgi:glycine cleavage system regulatory protein